MFNAIARQNNARPTFLSLRSSTAFITFVVAYAVFTDQFLFAVILPVFPFSLHDRSHVPQEKVQLWISLLLGVYAIACCITSPIWGWYADRTSSRRIPWLIGLIVLVAATLLLWLAPNNAVSLVGRILQGFATSIIWSTGLAIMVDTVGDARIGEYMGYIGIALNLGTMLAPILGGIVFAKAGYNAVFYMTFGVIAIDVLCRVCMIESETAKEWLPDLTTPAEDDHRKDLEINADPTIPSRTQFPTTMLEMAPSQSTRSTSPSPSAVKLTITRRLPAVITLLFSARFLAALVGVVALAAIYSGIETVLPLYTQRIFGWNSTGGGLIFLPFMLPSLLGPLVGKFVDRFGPRWPAAAGFALACPALVLLRVVDHDSFDQKAVLCVLLLLIGTGITLTMEPLMAEFTYMATGHDEEGGSEKTSYAQAYGLFNMAWAGGDTIGPFWAGPILDAYGWGTMAWSFGLLAGVSVIPAVLWCGGWIERKR